MDNVRTTPLSSDIGQFSLQSSAGDGDRQSTRQARSRSPAGTGYVPLDPRRSSGDGAERVTSFSDLPSELHAHIGGLSHRQGRAALRQTSALINQALPRGRNDVMSAAEGVQALRGIDQTTAHADVSVAIRRAIQAASKNPDREQSDSLLRAALDAVQGRANQSDQPQLLQEVMSALLARANRDREHFSIGEFGRQVKSLF